jgi:hypothetical protein
MSHPAAGDTVAARAGAARGRRALPVALTRTATRRSDGSLRSRGPISPPRGGPAALSRGLRDHRACDGQPLPRLALLAQLVRAQATPPDRGRLVLLRDPPPATCEMKGGGAAPQRLRRPRARFKESAAGRERGQSRSLFSTLLLASKVRAIRAGQMFPPGRSRQTVPPSAGRVLHYRPGVESIVAVQTRSAGRPPSPLGTVRQQSPVGLLRSPGTYSMPMSYVSCAVVVRRRCRRCSSLR